MTETVLHANLNCFLGLHVHGRHLKSIYKKSVKRPQEWDLLTQEELLSGLSDDSLETGINICFQNNPYRISLFICLYLHLTISLVYRRNIKESNFCMKTQRKEDRLLRIANRLAILGSLLEAWQRISTNSVDKLSFMKLSTLKTLWEAEQATITSIWGLTECN